jgi:hypothetical protein
MSSCLPSALSGATWTWISCVYSNRIVVGNRVAPWDCAKLYSILAYAYFYMFGGRSESNRSLPACLLRMDK